ncbi:MAG: polysaccharide deacetylase family protein [Tannerellaceae bacterium]|jgi:hypothetical protein|nr:polysaccharide deacetylase family protein [Tannerellaceae bacterium]
MNDIISYLINFLISDPGCNHGTNIAVKVGYTADISQFKDYDLVIIPSGFFNSETYGKPSSIPSLPLAEWEGIPLLYGHSKMEIIGKTLVLHADLIASAYFLLSRYEEIIRRDARDEHGRFPGKESLAYHAKFIHRPVIDEYRLQLQKLLKDKLPAEVLVKPRLKAVELTHDIDAPYLYRTWKGVIRSLIFDRRGIGATVRCKFGKKENDPYYTFPWLFEQDNHLSYTSENVHLFLFFKAAKKHHLDKPHYNPGERDIKHIANIFSKNKKTNIGLHISYEAGKKPSVEIIKKEKNRLEKGLNISTSIARHHFLSSREPEDMELLPLSGIYDDYTMGYADISGFRLGTANAVRWINPSSRQLTSLTLHPLIIMDCSLEEDYYMGLNHDEAKLYCLELIKNIKKTGGVISMLWHNVSAMENTGSYLRNLYVTLLLSIKNELKIQS